MSGLNFSTLHEELITSNFKTSLFGVCFQFGRFMTLNYFYTELAEFPLSYYLWYKNSHILPHHTAQRSSWLHQEMWPSSESLFCPSTPDKGSEGCSLPPYLKVFSKEGWGWPALALGGITWWTRKICHRHQTIEEWTHCQGLPFQASLHACAQRGSEFWRPGPKACVTRMLTYPKFH